MLLARESSRRHNAKYHVRVENSYHYTPCDAMDLWNLAGFEDSVGHTTEGSSDVESKYEIPCLATIWLPSTRTRLHRRVRYLTQNSISVVSAMHRRSLSPRELGQCEEIQGIAARARRIKGYILVWG